MALLLHLDCSEGISIPSLARALLSPDAPNGLSIEWIERKILVIFQDAVQEVRFQLNEPFYKIRFRENIHVKDLLTAINDNFEAQEQLQQRGRDFVGAWRTRREKHDDCSYSQELESVILSTCILLWFDKLHVQNLSVSPIPVLSTQITECPSLWTQLPVLLSSTVPFVSKDAVLLLRILIDLDKPSNITNEAIYTAPPMILTHQLIGEYHSPTPHITSISVGTPMIASKSSPLSCSLWQTDQLYRLEANIDDCTAEHLAFCVDVLFTRGGAADAWVAPIVMKKGRAAHTIYCLCKEANRHTCLELLFRHSTTLGVRVHELDRVALKRTMVTVKSNKWTSKGSTLGCVDVKIGYLGDQIVSVKAEFDHCKEIAKSMDLPVKIVAEEAVQLAKLQLN